MNFHQHDSKIILLWWGMLNPVEKLTKIVSLRDAMVRERLETRQKRHQGGLSLLFFRVIPNNPALLTEFLMVCGSCFCINRFIGHNIRYCFVFNLLSSFIIGRNVHYIFNYSFFARKLGYVPIYGSNWQDCLAKMPPTSFEEKCWQWNQSFFFLKLNQKSFAFVLW